MNREECSNCYYSRFGYSINQGPLQLRCYRYPPQCVGQNTFFPIVNEDNFCGEFKKRKDKE